jgi:hypothetical protein
LLVSTCSRGIDDRREIIFAKHVRFHSQIFIRRLF